LVLLLIAFVALFVLRWVASRGLRRQENDR